LNPELVVGHPLKKSKDDSLKTSLEEIKDVQGIYSNVKVNDDIYFAVMSASKNCPKLYQLLV
jgi:hypothetical protein